MSLNESQSHTSRREFLKAGSIAGAALAGGRALGQVNSKSEKKTAPGFGKLKIKVAGYKYDRVEALADGRVPIVGCKTQFEPAKIGEMNTHVFSGPKTREVTEIGLLPFILAVANEGFRDYSLLPIFPLRVFRHRSIFIRTDRGITKPDDLRGRRIATPGYSSRQPQPEPRSWSDHPRGRGLDRAPPAAARTTRRIGPCCRRDRA